MTVRITKTLCPSCEGTGKFRATDLQCLWCEGARRVPVATTRRYADITWTLAAGGYLAGDHDLEVMVEMETKAKRIYSAIGSTAPCRTPTPHLREVGCK